MKLFLSAGLILLSIGVSAKVVDRIVAVVNNQMITLSDLDSFRDNLKKDGLLDQALLSFYEKDKLLKDSDYALNYLIDTRIIDSAIDRADINVPIEAVESEIRDIARKSQTTKQNLIAGLKKRGILYSDYQDFVKTSMQRQSLLKREISSKIKISDEDVANFYIQNQKVDSKALVFEYSLAHILFVPEGRGGDADAKKRANDVLSQLRNGESFNAMAAKYSEDPRFSQGGLFGRVRAGEIVPELEKALNGVREGENTSVVKMADGYHIFRVLKRTLVTSDDFEKKKARIADMLFSDIFFRQYNSWIEDQRKSAFLKIHGKK